MLEYARACVSMSVRYRSGENNYMPGYIIYTDVFVVATANNGYIMSFLF